MKVKLALMFLLASQCTVGRTTDDGGSKIADLASTTDTFHIKPVSSFMQMTDKVTSFRADSEK